MTIQREIGEFQEEDQEIVLTRHVYNISRELLSYVIIQMVRNVKILEGKQYCTRKIKKIIIDDEDTQSIVCKNQILKEKNRQSAQRSRDNKKKFMTSLELKVAELENQNLQLRNRLEQSEKLVKFLESKLEHQLIPQHPLVQEIVKNSQQASAQTGTGQDQFQRLSTKSFISCGNFLMLALVMICCIFSFLETQHQISPSRSFYEQKNLNQILQNLKPFKEESFDFRNSQNQIKNKNSLIEKWLLEKAQTNSEHIYLPTY